MKSTSSLVTAFAALGFTVLPMHAADTATEEKPAAAAETTAEATQKTTPAYIVQVSGKG